MTRSRIFVIDLVVAVVVVLVVVVLKLVDVVVVPDLACVISNSFLLLCRSRMAALSLLRLSIKSRSLLSLSSGPKVSQNSAACSTLP